MHQYQEIYGEADRKADGNNRVKEICKVCGQRRGTHRTAQIERAILITIMATPGDGTSQRRIRSRRRHPFGGEWRNSITSGVAARTHYGRHTLKDDRLT